MIRSNIAKSTMTPIMLALLAGTALGEPEGEQIVTGQASFLRDGGLTQITAADNTIINYQSFNIGANETVRFIQPGANARVLNRVLGQDPSQINGSLLANGRVYIVNEAGVYFGNQAVVSVGAINAAAGTMTDNDFLGGIDRFSGLTGEVENQGLIQAGEVHFAGRRVTNLGSIISPDGLVTMTVGDEVMLGEYGGHLFVRASGADGVVEQNGEINAVGGAVLIGAGDMFSIAIGPGSTTHADVIDIRGENSIVKVSGLLDASNTMPEQLGGDITITGEGVAVLDAKINVSGDAGGGRIRIGGGARGLDTTIDHANRVNVNSRSSLTADAITTGNGGDIIIWSDSATLYTGDASAQGGEISGDGGFVEVSSTGWLGFFGKVSTAAKNGKDGLLLLDPVRINIVAGAAGSGADDSLLDDDQLPAGDAAGLDVVISEGTIEGLTDTDILIAATGDIAIGNMADGVLTLPVTSGNTFTFNAGGIFATTSFGTISTLGGNLEIRGVGGIQTGGVNTLGGDLLYEANESIVISGALDNINNLTLRALGGDRRIDLMAASATALSITADTLGLSGNLLIGSDLDLTPLMRVESSDADRVVSIGAVSGVSTFDITLDGSTAVTGPGGFRFIARRLSLFGISGLSALEVTATEELTLSGDILMDNALTGLGGRVDLSDADLITLATDVLIDTDLASVDAAAGNILFGDTTVQGAALQTQRLTLDTSSSNGKSAGRIVIGNIGGDTPLAGLSIMGGALELRGRITNPSDMDLSLVESIDIAGDVVIDTQGNNLFIGNLAIDGLGTLMIDLDTGMGASGILGFAGDIGANTPLESLAIDAARINLNNVTTTGDQTYIGDEIFLPEALISQGGTIDFQGKASVNDDATVTSIGGTVRFRELLAGVADITLVTESGNSIFEKSVFINGLTAMGDVNFNGSVQNIQTTDDLVLGELVGRDRIDMLSGAKSFTSTSGDIILNGPLNGPADVTMSVDTSGPADDLPIIRFGSNVGAAQSLAALTLGTGRASVPEVATIVAANFDADGEPLADQSFTFRTTGNFEMGQSEKLTALGSLLIESLSGVATLSDLTSVGAMRVNAPRIDVLSRAAGDLFEVDASGDPEALLDSAGRTDTGVDFVSGVSVTLDAAEIRILNPGFNQPVVAEPQGNAKIDGFQTRASAGLALEEVYFNRRTGTGGDATRDETTVMDARALGSVTVLLAQAIPSESADHAESFANAETLSTPNPDSGELPEGDQGGILLRSTTAQERRSARDGVIWHVDLAENVNPDAGDFKIASARMNQDAVRSFRGAWNELAIAVGVDASDSDEVLSRVRSMLAVAVNQYKDSSGEQFIDPQHFALFADLRSANSDAWQALQLVSAISSSSDNLGMTATESVRFRKGLIGSIRPDGLDAVDLDRLIEYAGHSDRQPMTIEGTQGQR